MEEVREEVTIEETAEAITPTPKRTVKPKVKAERTVEELDYVAPRYMTDLEKNKYILVLREKSMATAVRNEQLESATQSAYDRTRNAESEMVKVRDNANLKLKQVEDNVRVMANNIMNILGGK